MLVFEVYISCSDYKTSLCYSAVGVKMDGTPVGEEHYSMRVYVNVIMECSAIGAKQLFLKTSRFMKISASMCSFSLKVDCFGRDFASILWVLLFLLLLCS